MHPQAREASTPDAGANCQLYAYAVIALFDRHVPPHRSSELWEEPGLEHVSVNDMANLDLVLFNGTMNPWGAHVAVVIGDRLLHLSQEIGSPAIWEWKDFAERERYREIVGIVRPTRAHVSAHRPRPSI